MTKYEYKAVMRVMRGNGLYALKWLTPAQREVWETVRNAKADPLEQRAKTLNKEYV